MGKIRKGVVTVEVTYRAAWADPSGGRGWRLDPAIREAGPDVAPTDAAVPGTTSSLIHALLDQWIPGFEFVSHRSRAKAVVQLAGRTGVDPTPLLQELVEADLLREGPRGEELASLLPGFLAERMPVEAATDAERIAALQDDVGKGLLRSTLTAHLLQLGWEGMAPARATWIARGLDFRRRGPMGAALWALVEWMDRTVQDGHWEEAHGELAAADDWVRFRFDHPEVREWARLVQPGRPALLTEASV